MAGSLANQLLQLLLGTGMPGTIPSEALLEKAIKALGTIGLLLPADLPTTGPDVIMFLLKRLLREAHLPQILSQENLDTLFDGRCFGTPKGTVTRPANRATFPTGSGKRVDYLFTLDASTIPSRLLDQLGMTNPSDIGDLLADAIDRWNKVTNPKKITFQMNEGQKGTTLIVRFGSIDGAGATLAVTESQWSTGGPSTHTILVDLSETWTPAKLVATMTHELGHALGLDHVNDPNAIMAAMLPQAMATETDFAKIALTQTDIDALKTQGTPWV